MTQSIHSKFGQVVALPGWGVDNLNSSLTNGALAQFKGNVSIPMPWAGSIVGMAVKGNANCTAGSATFRAVVGSTQVTSPAPVINATNSAASTARRSAGEARFAAGDLLGLQSVTDATFAPTTIEYDAVIYVVYDVQ